MSRLKGMESKRRSDSKASAKSKESTRDKTSPKSTNLIPQSFSAQVTSKFPRISKLSKTKAEQIAALRRKLDILCHWQLSNHKGLQLQICFDLNLKSF